MASFGYCLRACFTFTALSLLIVAIVLPSTHAVSLITFDSASSNFCLGCVTLSWSHTTGSGLNRILIVGISDSDAAAVSGVTYGGTPLTIIIFQEDPLPIGRAEMWDLVNPPTGPAMVTVTLVHLTDSIVGGSVSYSNVGSLGPHSSSIGTTSNPSASVSANAGDLVVDTLEEGFQTVMSPGSGQTQRWNINPTNFVFIGAGSDKPASSPVTMTWSGAAAPVDWALIIVDLQPATIIPEYPLGLPILAILMIIGYGVMRRKANHEI